MLLPYSWEVYLDILAAYNADVFPLPILTTILGLALVFKLRHPTAISPVTLRVAFAMLVGSWTWVAWGFQWQVMSDLDFSAPIYAIGWGLQAIFFAWVLRAVWSSCPIETERNAQGLGFGLALIGLLGYPLLQGLSTHDWQTIPMIGFTPDPTAIFTMGLMLLWPKRLPIWAFIIPVIWGLQSAVAGYLLGHALGYITATALALGLAARLRAAK